MFWRGDTTYTSGIQNLDKLHTFIDVIYSPLHIDREDVTVKNAIETHLGANTFLAGTEVAGPLNKFYRAISYLFRDIDSQVENLELLTSISECPKEFLPYLSNLIGWRLRGNDENSWRNQIRNAVYHQHLENRLVRWLTEKKIIQQAFREKKISRGKFIHDMENSDSHIANITRDMRKLGLESMVYDKAAKRFNYFGKPYGPDVDKQFEGMLADIPKTYLLRNPPYSVSKGFDKSKREYWQKPIGHAKGGLIKKGIKKLMDKAVDLSLIHI